MLHNCKVTRVTDADTFHGQVDLDFGVSICITIRLMGCDAYEITGSEKSEGIKAKEYVETLIGGNTIVIAPYKQDSFGRWLCDVFYKGKSIKNMLKDQGYLKKIVEKV